MSNTQSRKYQLTINNPQEKEITHELIREKLKSRSGLLYYAMADEIGENGTLHIHIYAAFSSPVRFSTIKMLFPSAHIENAHGSSAENRAYILKEGEKYADKAETSVEGTFEEWGELPTDVGKGFRSDLALLFQLVRDGLTTNEIIEVNPDLIKYMSHIDKVRQMRLEEENKDNFRIITVTYIFGKTGTGKTRYVMEKEGYSSVYRVTDYKNPFDSYKGENVILFDEFSSSVKIQDMLNYLDGYPLELPCRYANKRALFTEVCIVSNLPLESQYPYEQKENKDIWKAFLRRINQVMMFKGNNEYTTYDKDEYFARNEFEYPFD